MAGDIENLQQPPHGKIDFEKLPNTRDLGGLPTAEGRHVKPRRLLRSGHLAIASAADRARLRDEYALALDIDLRTDIECSEQPDPVDAFPGMRFVHLPVFQEPAAGVSREDEGMEQLFARVMAGEVEPAQLMIGMYPHIVLDEMGVAAYTAFFKEMLAAEEGAVLWHCSAGKDRCGMASVFTEVALGVPWELVQADYMATNTILGIDPATCPPMEVLEGVDERFLAAAVKAMDEAYGSVEGYLRGALGLDDDAFATLRARYLA